MSSYEAIPPRPARSTKGGVPYATSATGSDLTRVEVVRSDSEGFGFILEGGTDTPAACVYISRIFPNSPAANHPQLAINDVVLSINGTSTATLDRDAVLRLFRTLGNRVEMQIRSAAAHAKHQATSDTGYDVLTRESPYDLMDRSANPYDVMSRPDQQAGYIQLRDANVPAPESDYEVVQHVGRGPAPLPARSSGYVEMTAPAKQHQPDTYESVPDTIVRRVDTIRRGASLPKRGRQPHRHPLVGNVSREEAEQILAHREPGCFVIRPLEAADQFAIALVTSAHPHRTEHYTLPVGETGLVSLVEQRRKSASGLPLNLTICCSRDLV
eukprot:m.183286 g.183286  ORF g.183286 m.183286 type:complete len:327 (-) comp10491_c1_seq5:44-1024(-)